MLQDLGLGLAQTVAWTCFSQDIFVLGQSHHQNPNVMGCVSSMNRISKYSHEYCVMLQDLSLGLTQIVAWACYSQGIFMLGHRHHQDQSVNGCASNTNRIIKHSQGHSATVQFLGFI
jgi:hypothetical protein